MMEDVGEDIPAWFRQLREIQEELSSVSLNELEESCRQLVRDCKRDSTLDHRIQIKIDANFAVASATPRFQLRRALRSFLEGISPKLHQCECCRHQRLVIGPVDARERLQCGTSQMFFPGRTCQDPDDQPLEWLTSANPPSTPENVERRPSTELHMLAMVAEAVRLEDSTRGRAPGKELGVRREEKTKGKRSTRRRSSGLLPSFQIKSDVEMAKPGQSMKTMSTSDHTTTPQPITPTRENAAPTFDTPSSRPRQEAVGSVGDRNSSGSSILAPMNINARLQTALNASAFQATRGQGVDQQPLHRALGRAISDPQVLQRELARGIPTLAEEDPTRFATAAAVLRAGVESSSYSPGRPLSRAISDPRKLQQNWQNSSEPLASALQSNIPARGNLVEWKATVRFTAATRPLDLFTLVGALPLYVAHSLPDVIPLSGIRSRDAIRMDTVIDKPLLLRIGKVDDAQRHAVEQMERNKIAAFAQFPGFDFVLVPHMNSRELLHIIGLRMEKTARPPSGSIQNPVEPPFLARTASAFPALGKEYGLYDAEAAKSVRSSKLKPQQRNLEMIRE